MLPPSTIDFISKQARDTKFSKNAFNCSKCPKEGCPAYWKFDYHLQDGENSSIRTKSTLEGCGFVLMPILLADMVESSSRASITACDNINTTKKGILAIAKLVSLGSDIKNLPEEKDRQKCLQ